VCEHQAEANGGERHNNEYSKFIAQGRFLFEESERYVGSNCAKQTL